ncbi:hypothetical protein BDY19DRAFT_904200 [Irpex rosettiformis]|uniref:Uncharacterized protein n=1 Tax=Irpex rosettiformis TaxID=378272 RepID=A0ACB8UAY1_9APHY|nr:hypothetical protein BDY19DRAFT_904200 [Irpex rosettiformis]
MLIFIQGFDYNISHAVSCELFPNLALWPDCFLFTVYSFQGLRLNRTGGGSRLRYERYADLMEDGMHHVFRNFKRSFLTSSVLTSEYSTSLRSRQLLQLADHCYSSQHGEQSTSFSRSFVQKNERLIVLLTKSSTSDPILERGFAAKHLRVKLVGNKIQLDPGDVSRSIARHWAGTGD